MSNVSVVVEIRDPELDIVVQVNIHGDQGEESSVKPIDKDRWNDMKSVLLSGNVGTLFREGDGSLISFLTPSLLVPALEQNGFCLRKLQQEV